MYVIRRLTSNLYRFGRCILRPRLSAAHTMPIIPRSMKTQKGGAISINSSGFLAVQRRCECARQRSEGDCRSIFNSLLRRWFPYFRATLASLRMRNQIEKPPLKTQCFLSGKKESNCHYQQAVTYEDVCVIYDFLVVWASGLMICTLSFCPRRLRSLLSPSVSSSHYS